MPKSSILIIGSGGHAKSIIDLLQTNDQYEILGLIGKPENIDKEILGYKIIGSDKDLGKIRSKVSNAVVAIGQIKDVKLRQNIFTLLKQYNYRTPCIVSKYSYISSYSVIGEGTCIGHNVVVNAGVNVGKYCILNTKCLIEHDSIIGDFCHISTGVLVNGNVNIGSESFIGSGSIIREGITIPSGTVVSSGKRIMNWPMKK